MNVHADFEGAEHAVHDALQFQHAYDVARTQHRLWPPTALPFSAAAATQAIEQLQWKRRRAHEDRMLLWLMAWPKLVR